MQTTQDKKELVAELMQKGVLISTDMLGKLDDQTMIDQVRQLLDSNSTEQVAVLNDKIQEILFKDIDPTLNVAELEKLKALSEKNNSNQFNQSVDITLQQKPQETTTTHKPVQVLESYEKESHKHTTDDFTQHYVNRYNTLQTILKQRAELANIVSITRVNSKRDREEVSIIGMVSDVQTTANGNCMLTVEDPTGSIKLLVNKNKPDMFEQAKNIMLDEVIGAVGVGAGQIIFANSIYFPDIPLSKELKMCEDDTHAIFLSDIHIGSDHFLEADFERFLTWITGELGNETQKSLAAKIKYIFIIGDLVDGCGIYPGQESELVIKDLKDQYKKCAEYLERIPKHIHLIICPGNHDAMRIAEPQLPFYRDFCEELFQLENATIVANPAMVRIHQSEDFEGFDVLMYHGYSFDFFISEVETIRNNGGYDRADLIMKYLLQKRHLAPTHTSTQFVPDTEADPLVVNHIPDFFVSGHIHKTAVAQYRNITLISGSCWQSKTPFQEKVGHHPEPSRVPIVNLKTRDVKVLRFGTD